MVDMERTGEIINRLRRLGAGSVETDAADMMQELMNECMRWQARADRAERHAKAVIYELREAWSGRDVDAVDQAADGARCGVRGVCKTSGQLVFCLLAVGHVGDHYGVDLATGGAEYHAAWKQKEEPLTDEELAEIEDECESAGAAADRWEMRLIVELRASRERMAELEAQLAAAADVISATEDAHIFDIADDRRYTMGGK